MSKSKHVDQAPDTEQVPAELVTVELIEPVRRGVIMHLVGERIDVPPRQASWLAYHGKAKRI